MSLFNTVNIVRFGGYNRGGRGTEHPLRFFLRKEYGNRGVRKKERS